MLLEDPTLFLGPSSGADTNPTDAPKHRSSIKRLSEQLSKLTLRPSSSKRGSISSTASTPPALQPSSAATHHLQVTPPTPREGHSLQDAHEALVSQLSPPSSPVLAARPVSSESVDSFMMISPPSPLASPPPQSGLHATPETVIATPQLIPGRLSDSSEDGLSEAIHTPMPSSLNERSQVLPPSDVATLARPIDSSAAPNRRDGRGSETSSIPMVSPTLPAALRSGTGNSATLTPNEPTSGSPASHVCSPPRRITPPERYYESGLVDANGTIFQFGEDSIDPKHLRHVGCSRLRKGINICDFSPNNMLCLSDIELASLAKSLKRRTCKIFTYSPDLSSSLEADDAPPSPIDPPEDNGVSTRKGRSVSVEFKTPGIFRRQLSRSRSRAPSERSTASTKSALKRGLVFNTDKPPILRRLAQKQAILLSKKHPVTQLTRLFLALYTWGDTAALLRVFNTHPDVICRDIRIAQLAPLLPASTVTMLLRRLQETILRNGTSSNKCVGAAVQLLIASVNDEDADISEVGINAKLEGLFEIMERVEELNMPFYGVRCGLVFGSLMVYESIAAEAKTTKWVAGASGVSSVALAAGSLGSIHGVPVGAIASAVAQPANACFQTQANQKINKYKHGIRLVKLKFDRQVLGDAKAGLLSSYKGNAPLKPPAIFTKQELDEFQIFACEVYNMVLDLEGRFEERATPPNSRAELRSLTDALLGLFSWLFSWRSKPVRNTPPRIESDRVLP